MLKIRSDHQWEEKSIEKSFRKTLLSIARTAIWECHRIRFNLAAARGGLHNFLTFSAEYVIFEKDYTASLASRQARSTKC